MFNDLGESVPVLSAVRPNGPDTIEDFEAAGGAHALLKQLDTAARPERDDRDRSARVAENLADAVVANEEVIRPITRPYSDKASITILRGSLAPESAIVKLGLRGEGRIAHFSGPAVVYDDGSAAMQAIARGDIMRGQVLVVRGMGPKGGPGMAGPASGGRVRVRRRRSAERCCVCQRRTAFRIVQQGTDCRGSVAGIGGRWPHLAGRNGRSYHH